MKRKLINFNAGPAALPESVLNTIDQQIVNWQDMGLSILELGHRTLEFSALAEKLEASVRRILKVPDDFTILMLPGGANVLFSMLVMNLIGDFKTANYINTGYWSKAAIKEALKYTDVHIAASSEEQGYNTIPDIDTWDITKDAAFLHFTDNETIGGVEFSQIPAIENMVLVSDMTSSLFSKPIDFKRIGCIYASAQKNFGIAGMSLVIVRRDLLDRALPETPSVFHFANQDKSKSLLATPPTFAFYVASLVLDWIEEEGGVESMAERNLEKSTILYHFLDKSNLYHNPIDKKHRSRMNIPFTMDSSKESAFFNEAKKMGLLYLEGHRSIGGARASIYNAISTEQVNRLVDFLQYFETHY